MNLKKFFISSVFAFAFSTLIPGTALAASQPYNQTTLEDSSISPYAEETKWYYQKVDGVWQKRLWSLTYGVWLTDWMPL